MTMRVAIYARYSSDNQREASIEDQIRICTAWAEREGWTIVGAYSDAAISGTTLLRPGYQALLEFMRAGKADIVLAESLDRFSRDLEHVAAFHKQAQFSRVKIITLAEGEIGDLHVGLKGTMGALYLKDLAQKTRRGMEGIVRKGLAPARAPYGYQVVRRLAANGEPERGLREIDPVEAPVVRRIFADYASGKSPLAIARMLNAEGIPGPKGGTWYDRTIRGRPKHGDGLLRNTIYAGLLRWNRAQHVVDPLDGRHVKRLNPADQYVQAEVPHLRIVPSELWERVQSRLVAEALPAQKEQPFWDRRRPRHLLTGKVVCGCCGRTFTAMGKDYLGCEAAKNRGGCRNTHRVRRPTLEARVLAALATKLMRPEALESFCDGFIAEWNRLAAEAAAGAAAREQALRAVDRKIENLIEAVANGLKAGGVQKKLEELEAQKAALEAEAVKEPPPAPALHPSLATVYAARIARLREALDAGDGTEALEAARALVEKVVVSPPEDPDGEPDIELVGDLMALLQAGGTMNTPEAASVCTEVLRSFQSSVKGGQGEFTPPTLSHAASVFFRRSLSVLSWPQAARMSRPRGRRIGLE